MDDPDWLKRIRKCLSTRKQELDGYQDTLGLVNSYIEPYYLNSPPGDILGDEVLINTRRPVFGLLDDFMQPAKEISTKPVKHLIVFSDFGMGKTSLLTMLKLAHSCLFWPNANECRLFNLGITDLNSFANLSSPESTILLLDDVVDNANGTGSILSLLNEVISVTSDFYRTVIACSSSYLVPLLKTSTRRLGYLSVGGIECSLIHLSFFDDRQVDAYLKKRYSVGPLSEFSGKVKYESERLNRFLTQIGSLRSMPWILANLNVFMHAALVDYDANISCSCFDWDAESAYSQIVNRVLIRENIRLGLFNHSDSLVVTDLWKVCIAIASHMALMQRRYVSTGELYNIINHGSAFQDLKPEVVSTLPLLSKNSNGDCSFIHHSLQEFFVRFSDEKNLYYESQDTSVEIVHIVQLISAELLEYLKRHPDELYHLRPRQFEELVGEILSSYGWQVSITPASKDGGYDLFGIMKDVSGVSTSWIIECKKYGPENKVGVEIVRGLWGVKQDLRIANAMLATTSYFTRGVHEFKSSRYDLELRDYDGILKWLSEYKPSSDGKLYLSGNRLVLPNNPK